MKRLFSILFCLALLGCQQQNDTSKPEDLIPEEKMVQILADVHVMESLIEANLNYPDSAAMVYNVKHREILEKYGVSNDQFHRTYNYYGNNLPAMDKLYEIIMDTLTAREAKLEAKSVTAPAGNDTTQANGADTAARPLRRSGPHDRILQAPEEQLL